MFSVGYARFSTVLQLAYMPLDILIEGLLFYKSSPQKKAVLLKMLEVSEGDLTDATGLLKVRLESGATRLIETADDLQLVTAPAFAPIIETLRKNELKADISKAGAETLAIILYQEPISRTEIDRVRGVNSSFILRNLQIRGLIDRVAREVGGGYVYKITPTLLAYLGVTHKHELPDFARIADTLEKFSAQVTETTV